MYLALWFDDGANGLVLLEPYQRVTSIGFAIHAFGPNFLSNGNVMRIVNNRTSPGGSIDFVVGAQRRLLIASTGYIGIGTSNPATRLDVNGIISAVGGNSTEWNAAYGWGAHSDVGYDSTIDSIVSMHCKR